MPYNNSRQYATREEELAMVDDFVNGMPISQILVKYNYKTDKSITDKVKKHYPDKYKDLIEQAKLNRRSWSVDFSKIESEFTAYFVGLMITDGYVTRGRTFGIDLSDEDCIAFLSQVTGKEYHTYEYANPTTMWKDGRTTHNRKPRHRIVFSSKQEVEKLKRFGIIENKSLTIQPPQLYEDEMVYIPYIMRGIIDGNGTISPTSYGAPHFQIVSGSEASIRWIKEMLEQRMFMHDIHLSSKTPNYPGASPLWKVGTALLDNMCKLQALSYNKPFGMMRKYAKLREMLRDYNRDNLEVAS